MTPKTTDEDTPGRESPPEVEPWNLVADGYTAVILPMSEHFAREALRLASLPPSPHIVDVAAGPGPLTILAAKDGAVVSAIDFSPAMVANLRRRADELGFEIADLRVGDGQNLPYSDNSFDGAFSLLGLVFFPDRAAGFRELRRVLRPGRRAVVSSMASLSAPLIAAVNIINSVLPELPLPQGEPPLGDPETFTQEMSTAGFVDVVVHTIPYYETTPSVSDFWKKVQMGAGFVTQLQHKMGEERWAEMSQAVLDRLVDKLGGGQVDEVYTNHLGVGVK
jgi:ubiquinone/menaquinone biosynthesis C-methylase UbiE